MSRDARGDGVTITRPLVWIIHQGSTAGAYVIESTALRSVGLLAVAMATAAEASVATPCFFNKLHLLATNPGE